MQYLIVENKEIIHLGPIFWRHRFIQSELDDLEVEFAVPPVEPSGYLKITDQIEIFPITNLETPSYDPTYEQLNGPFWTFADDSAIGAYTVSAKPLDTIKNDLMSLAAAERYKKEVAGTKATVQGKEVFVDTSRDGRNVFIQKYMMMNDTDTVQWKFPDCWLTLTKLDLAAVISAGANHIEQQFVWEQSIVSQIEAAETVEQLKAIIIIEPTMANGVI